MKKILYLFLLIISAFWFIGCQNSSDEEVLFRVAKNWKYGYVNKNGKIIIPLEYDILGDFDNNLAIAEKIINYFI